jgi:hemoglobin
VQERSLLDKVGGPAVLRAAVAVLYRRAAADPALAGYFAGVDVSRLEAHQRRFLTAALGGPDASTGRSTAAAHTGMGVTDAAYDRLVDHALDALADLGAAPDDVVAVGAALQVYRRDVVARS